MNGKMTIESTQTTVDHTLQEGHPILRMMRDRLTDAAYSKVEAEDKKGKKILVVEPGAKY